MNVWLLVLIAFTVVSWVTLIASAYSAYVDHDFVEMKLLAFIAGPVAFALYVSWSDYFALR